MFTKIRDIALIGGSFTFVMLSVLYLAKPKAIEMNNEIAGTVEPAVEIAKTDAQTPAP